MLRARLLHNRESGFSCALLLLVVIQLHLVLRLRFLLGWVVLLLLPLLCPAHPAVSSVRRPHDPAGVAVACPAMGLAERRRSVLVVGLLPLVLLAAGRGPIGRPPSLRRKPKPRPLLPELDVCLEVLLAIFNLLRRVTARVVLDLWVGQLSRPRERSVIAQVLVVDPPRLRVWRVTTGLVLSTRLTLTGMTLSGQSWASSGTSTAWKSRQVSHQLDARLLLHRSMG